SRCVLAEVRFCALHRTERRATECLVCAAICCTLACMSKLRRRSGGATARDLVDELPLSDEATRTAYALRGAEADVDRHDGKLVSEIARQPNPSTQVE